MLVFKTNGRTVVQIHILQIQVLFKLPFVLLRKIVIIKTLNVFEFR